MPDPAGKKADERNRYGKQNVTDSDFFLLFFTLGRLRLRRLEEFVLFLFFHNKNPQDLPYLSFIIIAPKRQDFKSFSCFWKTFPRTRRK